MNAALSDIQTNHPNDYMSMIFFSQPQTGVADTTNGDRFNRVRVALGQNYTYLSDSLWYPPATYGNTSGTVTCYDANNVEVPRAIGGTCYPIALMLAYNQFSSNSSLQTYNPGEPTGDAGGNGRQGRRKSSSSKRTARRLYRFRRLRQQRRLSVVLPGPLQQREPVGQRLSYRRRVRRR